MTIRAKITFIVLPLIIGPLMLTGFASSYTARNGITQVTTELLRFKAEEIEKYSRNQWLLLLENDLQDNQDFLQVSKAAIQAFAGNMIRNDTEIIFAINREGAVEMQTADISPGSGDKEFFLQFWQDSMTGWQVFFLNEIERVAHVIYFEPFEWLIIVTQHREVFYQAINQILVQTGLILSISLAAAIILLVFFANRLTIPLRGILFAMKEIISSNDLSRKVELLYNDEIGELGHTFNIMTDELEKAYDQIKIYALETAIAQKKEQRIRNIFQKYVPKEVIDRYFKEPEGLLEGEDRILAVLFSDIRGFTSLSEGMRPGEVVESLNSYFSAMVDIIMERKGIVDKYIGDAIMAFFGAPVKHEEDAYLALQAAFEMQSAVKFFNKVQRSRGAPEFTMGIGINYGIVTVGNIGSERKMDYTVIGDMVNIASRIESLTKLYKESIVISESVYRQAVHHVPCRMLDRVTVKGKGTSISIYTAREQLTPAEEKGWELYHNGLYLYYDREFKKAMEQFEQVQLVLPEDFISQVFYERCQRLIDNPPPDGWTGEIHMIEK
ncbi:MAG TPA: adenylate/guanylate cyclase domain-containing protein [Spirochaeta sp.]|nr:adenylate/guanylate cyclase domain-containing protein [Spirochaeta sp.]